MDMFHIVGAAYCTTAFVDGRTRDALVKGATERTRLKRIRRNGEFESWVAGL